MRYDAHLSMILKQDIYVHGTTYYLQYGSNHHQIGTVGTPVKELRLAVENFLA